MGFLGNLIGGSGCPVNALELKSAKVWPDTCELDCKPRNPGLNTIVRSFKP